MAIWQCMKFGVSAGYVDWLNIVLAVNASGKHITPGSATGCLLTTYVYIPPRNMHYAYTGLLVCRFACAWCISICEVVLHRCTALFYALNSGKHIQLAFLNAVTR